MLIRHPICAALSTVFVCSTLAAQRQCGLNNVRGTWSYSAVGWAVPLQPANATPVPYVMIGVMVVDYGGKISGPGTGIMGGVVMHPDLRDGLWPYRPAASFGSTGHCSRLGRLSCRAGEQASSSSRAASFSTATSRTWLRPLFIAGAAADNEVEVYRVSRTGDPGSRADVTG